MEVDTVDAWVLERPHLSWWNDSCKVLSGPPQKRHIDWVDTLVEALGPYPNVFFQIGNETFDCQGMLVPEWEEGIRDAIKEAYRKRGRVAPPIGTNSHDPFLESEMDYIARHGVYVVSPGAGPTIVNEYNPNPPLTASRWRELAIANKRNGVAFMLWRHSMGDVEFEKALRFMREIIETP